MAHRRPATWSPRSAPCTPAPRAQAHRRLGWCRSRSSLVSPASEGAHGIAVRDFAGVDGLVPAIGLTARTLALRLVAHAAYELALARAPANEAGVALGTIRLFQACEAGSVAGLDVARKPLRQPTIPRRRPAVDLRRNRQTHEKDEAISHWGYEGADEHGTVSAQRGAHSASQCATLQALMASKRPSGLPHVLSQSGSWRRVHTDWQ